MSNKNYSKFSNKKNNTDEQNQEPKNVEEVVNEQITFDELIENSDLEENSNKEVQEEVANEEKVDEEILEDINVKTIGTLINCEKLNVRKEANVDSEILTVVSKDEQLSIDVNNSTDHFYKVMTSKGIEGYCMKQYVAVV